MAGLFVALRQRQFVYRHHQQFGQTLCLHLAGKGARYTRMHRPVGIALTIEFDTKSLALQAEHAIKQMSASQKQQFILEHQ